MKDKMVIKKADKKQTIVLDEAQKTLKGGNRQDGKSKSNN